MRPQAHCALQTTIGCQTASLLSEEELPAPKPDATDATDACTDATTECDDANQTRMDAFFDTVKRARVE